MYKNIVLPIDLSTSCWKIALPIALNFVHTFGSQLHLVKIIPDIGISILEEYLPKKWIRNQQANHAKQLDQIVEQYIPAEIKVQKFVGRGHVYTEIMNYANNVGADLLIVPTSRPQLQDYMLETAVSKIVRNAKTSVLIVRE